MSGLFCLCDLTSFEYLLLNFSEKQEVPKLVPDEQLVSKKKISASLFCYSHNICC